MNQLSQFQLATQLLYAVAIPYFFVAMWLEFRLIKSLQGRKPDIQGPIDRVQGYELKDSLCSIAMGALKLMTTAIALIWSLPLMAWLYQHKVFELGISSWWFIPLLIVGDDFCYYWYHRVAHRCALFWAEHSNHHTSEHYNLSTALRQSVLGPFYSFVFWLPLAWLGFDPVTLAFAHTVNLLYQYWIHSEVFEVHGWFEKVFHFIQEKLKLNWMLFE
ncbi:sterol desaturase family protein [Limnobacter humi]|uniref:Sterol desaturase family protein n=1 Tax=Limnobacter humi TaxID=1778671 RepID=A0ABT1WGR1_9BURK|nr:sterol desaturase family protein [Limnobacter humi]MCQ8896711.1 sterol desaturase family protein [Limnobacter humi]